MGRWMWMGVGRRCPPVRYCDPASLFFVERRSKSDSILLKTDRRFVTDRWSDCQQSTVNEESTRPKKKENVTAFILTSQRHFLAETPTVRAQDEGQDDGGTVGPRREDYIE